MSDDYDGDYHHEVRRTEHDFRAACTVLGITSREEQYKARRFLLLHIDKNPSGPLLDIYRTLLTGYPIPQKP